MLAPASGSGLEEVLWNWFRNQVCVKGGGGEYSAQIALGQTAEMMASWPA